MAEDDDESQKTEDPTSKRLSDAVEKGQVVTSRELMSFGMLLAFTLLFSLTAPGLFLKTDLGLAKYIERPDTMPMDEADVGVILMSILRLSAEVLLVPFLAFIVTIFLVNAAQNRFVFSVDPIIPSYDKISLMKGLGRLFSLRSLTEFAKSTAKIIITGIIAYYAIVPYMVYIKQMPGMGIAGILTYLILTTKRMLTGICIVMFFIAMFDFFYQRYEYIKGLRMSKQEVKDEYKQQEGDPQVKRRLRQIRMERARKRMMAAVPTADVVITNPTHYSIALKYDSTVMRAPRLVAKGLDNVALRIREVAKEHDIPLVENPPLAQTLYATVDVDKEIPTEHYKAVAEIISYVYRLRGRFAGGARR